MAIAYRPDVDGLRALAVTGVLAYHFSFPHAHGGFLGVDVFFVISGFLITSLITRELDERRFTITDFYKRRVRRIFPALFAMMAVLAVGAVLTMFSSDLRLLRDNLLATTFFSSNIYFWQHSDYFAAPAATQPLLHTWSLSVEEQFYVLFPLLLLALHRWASSWRNRVLWLTTLGSLVLCALVQRHDPTASFYLLPTRAWELGAGALVAVGALPALTRSVPRQLASCLGLVLIVAALIGLTTKTPHVWPPALLAVMGTVLVILAGREALAGRLLALPPVVFVGLISYSLYLWHWPLLVLYRDETLRGPTPKVGVELAAISLVLAVLSWRFVERPLRKLRFPSTRRLVAVVAATLAAGVAVAAVVQPAGASVHPTTPEMHRLLSYDHYDQVAQFQAGTCFIGSDPSVHFHRDPCLALAADRPNVLVLGDSHAADLWQGISQSLPGAHVLQATASGCKALASGAGAARCTAVRDFVLDQFLPAHHLDAIVVSSRWTAEDLPALLRTIALVRPHATLVVVAGPHVTYETALPTLLARGLANHDPGLAHRRLLLPQFAIDSRFGPAVRAAGADYVSLTALLCPQEVCLEYAAAGIPVEFDEAHLTAEGSALVGRAFASSLKALSHQP